MVTVTLDKQKVMARIKKSCEYGTFVLANELLKDANKYVRIHSHTMMKTSLTASQPEKGLLIWKTPYAKRVYYAGYPSKKVNPNASLQWAHKAAKENREKYKAMLQKLASKGK